MNFMYPKTEQISSNFFLDQAVKPLIPPCAISIFVDS